MPLNDGAAPLRVLFCIGVNQNFFDLPSGGEGPAQVWKGFQTMLGELAAHPGVRVLGTLDDDQHMVGPSEGWPWTCYVLAEADGQSSVAEACNLFRTVPVGEHMLWRYMRVEARIGRELTIPQEAAE
jgi:hypothetical protein